MEIDYLYNFLGMAWVLWEEFPESASPKMSLIIRKSDNGVRLLVEEDCYISSFPNTADTVITELPLTDEDLSKGHEFIRTGNKYDFLAFAFGIIMRALIKNILEKGEKK